MKKILSLLLVIALLFCLSACSTKGISMSKLCSEFSKQGYEVMENDSSYYTMEDFGLSPRFGAEISSWEIWRELDSGAADWGQIICLQFSSADDAVSAYDIIMESEDEYYEIDFETKEGRNSYRVIADEYEYCEFFILSRIGNTIVYVYLDYEDFEDVGQTYDYIPLKIFDRLGY